MSYRNDHDAALARVDALAADNNRLLAENARLRAGETVELPHAARSNRRGPILAASFAGVAIAMAIGLITFAGAPVHAPKLPLPEAPLDDKPVVTFTRGDLEKCSFSLVTTPADRDAPSTDPHGEGRSVRPVLQSTGCRAEIRDVLTFGTISAKERKDLEAWADAEARLDATVAMVGEYYKGDPYALDGYSSAPQLWTEYNRALVIRNEAIKEWRRIEL
ncbi:MAG TPA: hypothetical protein VL326_32410 [Kofleriaceae bacterium]|jgi:hypothetical protein|nr:hypothetical protein [Kofleriaceae bacterium]